jgi:hypothetical protein
MDMPMTRRFGAAYYQASIQVFRCESVESIIGKLTLRSGSVDGEQKEAWVQEIQLLQRALLGLSGTIFLEFTVPRIGDRIDAVLITHGIIFPIEFKVGASRFSAADINQAWDYALDLKNFHEGSRDRPIVPILVATEAAGSPLRVAEPYTDLVYAPIQTGAKDLAAAIENVILAQAGTEFDALAWENAAYKPTPTIIEAARVLYASHSVQALACNEAGENLAHTASAVDALVEQARTLGRKIVVFVTGVPGAGKTLVGLDTATRRHKAGDTHASLLSGNGPLVEVLTEALARDEIKRRRAKGAPARKGDVRQAIKGFIQIVHHFRDAGIRAGGPPSEHVVIFDEAQRAWDRQMTSDFMRRKKGLPGFNESEPELLLSYMNRHPDWAVVVCLVGGGQEINRGEAGIAGWLDAIRTRFSDWDVHISPELRDSEYAAAQALDRLGAIGVFPNRHLHLAVSMRSFRAESVSGFVKSVLDSEIQSATTLLAGLLDRYPIAVSRDLDAARLWIRTHARGSERSGLVATSGALRLKPHAIDIRAPINPVHWFLGEPDDIRSSSFLEDAATEFQVQGLELDWACVNWDADLRRTESGWSTHTFSGSKWKSLKNEARVRYLFNAYRVLLTRARQGMVIFVPPGNPEDSTRLPAFYDSTYEYLKGLGVRTV